MANKKTKVTNKKGKWSIIIGFIILFFVLIGSVISGVFAGLNGQLGSQFYDSYNVRYEFDPYSVSNNPADGEVKTDSQTLYEQTVADMNEIAKNYSYMLLDQGINSTNVYPEVYIDANNIVHAYLNATIEISKVESSDTKISSDSDKKQDLAPSIAFYNNMNAADFSILYCDGYTVTTDSDTSTDTSNFSQAKLYMWDINGDVNTNRDVTKEGITDKSSKITIDSSNSSQIDIQLANTYTFGKGDSDNGYDSGSVKDTFYQAASESSSDTNDVTTSKYPFMIIFHNLQGLINEMEFYVYLAYQYYNLTPGQDNYDIINTAWWQLDDNTRSFANTVVNTDWAKYLVSQNSPQFSSVKFDTNCGFQANPYNKLISGSWSNNSNGIYSGSNNYVDSKFLSLLQSSDANGNPILGKSSSPQYTFMNKYILGVVTKDNYTDYLPDKNPKKDTLDSDGQWLTIPVSSYYFTTDEICKQMSDYTFPIKLMSVSYPYAQQSSSEQWATNINNTGLNSGNNSAVSLIDNTIHDSAVGINNGVITSFIAIAIVILVVGIVVSVLYRIPGLVMWICSLLPITLIYLILFLSNFGLSMSMIFASLIIFMACMIASINLLNKIKKIYLMHRTADQAIESTYTTCFFKTLDIFAIGVLMGVAIILFPSGSMLSFGICLIVGMLFAFISTYFISYLINILIFKNNIGMYKYSWLCPIKLKDNLTFDSRYANKLDVKVSKFNDQHFADQTYVSRIKTVNTIAFKDWFNVLMWTIIVIVFVIGISLLFTVGVPYSYSFYGGTRIMILNDGTVNINEVMSLLPDPSSWYSPINNGLNNYYVIESSKEFTYLEINNALSTLNLTVFTQTINTTISIQSTYDVLYSVLVFSALILVYSLIRYNWISIIPNVLVGSFIIALTISLTVIFQIKFDTSIFYSVYFITVLAYIMIFNMLGAINTSWTKTHFHTFTDLILIYQYSISGYNDNQLLIYGMMLLSTFINMLFLPTTLISISIINLIGIVLMFVLINFVWPRFIEIINNRKNIYKIRVKNIHLGIEKRNYDKIDEELIDGININTKKIQ